MAAARFGLELRYQLGGLFLIEHAAERRGRHQRRGLPVELVPLGEISPLLDALDGSAHAGTQQMRGIHDDDAEKLATGRLAVREPETRHGPGLGAYVAKGAIILPLAQ